MTPRPYSGPTRTQLSTEASHDLQPAAAEEHSSSEAADDVSSIKVRACAGQGQDVQRAYPQKNAGQSVCSGEAFVSRQRPRREYGVAKERGARHTRACN